MEPVEQGGDLVVVASGAGQVVAEQLAWPRAAPEAGVARGSRTGWKRSCTLTSSAVGRISRTVSASPGRGFSATITRSQVSVRSAAMASSSSSVPVLVARPRAEEIGASRTTAGRPGSTVTSSAPGVLSSSPKSTARGEPLYQIGQGPGICWRRCRWPSAAYWVVAGNAVGSK
ncbi:hypothetical protein ACFQ0B_45795 [Nonomuraea thailandensis]